MLAIGILLFITGGLHLTNYTEMKSTPTTFELIGAIAALLQLIAGIGCMLASIPAIN